MDQETATLYLSGKKGILAALVERGYLKPVSNRIACKTFRRKDLDTALAMAIANGDDLKPKPKGEE